LSCLLRPPEAAIAELVAQGYALPAYPANPATAAEAETLARYKKVLGSAVNPVLREGNSDRRCAAPVKAFARKHPHKARGWRTR
jgi:isocitrate dehydrogenase